MSPVPAHDGEAQLAAEDYCRQVEVHLCKKNDGHLIRIVGPAFEQVCSWATTGIPLPVALRGIDRYFERYYAKGPRRRPVQVQFCEPDVLDAFGEWRRALGITTRSDTASSSSGEVTSASARRQPSLHAHLDRVIARLTALRAPVSPGIGPASASSISGDRGWLTALVDDLVRELDAARCDAKSLRGSARAAFLDRLRTLERSLLEAVRQHTPSLVLVKLEGDADAELAPFRDRMPPESYASSHRACIDRLLSEYYRLPVIAFE